MSSIRRRVRGDQVEVADRLRRRPGQRHVDAVPGEPLGRSPRRRARRRATRSATRAPGGPRCRALPTGAALVGRKVGDAAQDRRQLGLAAEVADAELLELVGAARRLPIASVASLPYLLDPLIPSVFLRGGRRYPLQRDRSRGRDVERLGAGAQRDRHLPRRTAPAQDSAAAPRAPPRGRRWPRPSRPRAARRRGRPAPPAARASPSSSARASGWVKTAPMLARTALGPNGSAQPGPSTTVPPTSAAAVRTMVPTLPGSETPCR